MAFQKGRHAWTKGKVYLQQVWHSSKRRCRGPCPTTDLWFEFCKVACLEGRYVARVAHPLSGCQMLPNSSCSFFLRRLCCQHWKVASVTCRNRMQVPTAAWRLWRFRWPIAPWQSVKELIMWTMWTLWTCWHVAISVGPFCKAFLTRISFVKECLSHFWVLETVRLGFNLSQYHCHYIDMWFSCCFPSLLISWQTMSIFFCLGIDSWVCKESPHRKARRQTGRWEVLNLNLLQSLLEQQHSYAVHTLTNLNSSSSLQDFARPVPSSLTAPCA